MYRLTSRKFLMSVAAALSAIAAALTGEVEWSVAIFAMAGMVSVYVASEAYVDGKAVQAPERSVNIPTVWPDSPTWGEYNDTTTVTDAEDSPRYADYLEGLADDIDEMARAVDPDADEDPDAHDLRARASELRVD